MSEAPPMSQAFLYLFDPRVKLEPTPEPELRYAVAWFGANVEEDSDMAILMFHYGWPCSWGAAACGPRAAANIADAYRPEGVL